MGLGSGGRAFQGGGKERIQTMGQEQAWCAQGWYGGREAQGDRTAADHVKMKYIHSDQWP